MKLWLAKIVVQGTTLQENHRLAQSLVCCDLVLLTTWLHADPTGSHPQTAHLRLL